MKTLVICPGLKHYYFSMVQDKDVFIIEEPFVSIKSNLKRNMERLLKRVGFWRLYKITLHRWWDIIKKCDNCIIFDQAFSKTIIYAIHSINPKISLHVYLWNPVFKEPSIVEELKKVERYIKIYSFDKNDCRKYGFRFSPMVYNFHIPELRQNEYEYDVVFVGYLKNRAKMLMDLYNYIVSKQLKQYFYVLDNVDYKGILPFELHKSYLDYSCYNKVMQKSRAILDITQEGQIGLTIRTLETIAYKKKLITNNVDIANYDFYNSQNIFIIGKDDLNMLNQFIDLPYQEIEWDILKQYNFIDWVKNFEVWK